MDDYDPGILNDYGAGNVQWWQNYIRCEISKCNEFHEARIEQLEAEKIQLERAIWSTKCELQDMHLGEVLDVPIEILQKALEGKDG